MTFIDVILMLCVVIFYAIEILQPVAYLIGYDLKKNLDWLVRVSQWETGDIGIIIMCTLS